MADTTGNPMDVGSLLEQMQQNNAAAAKQTQQITDLYQQAGNVMDDITSLAPHTLLSNGKTVDQMRLELTGQLEAQNKVRRIAHNMNWEGAMNAAAADFAVSSEKERQLRATLEKQASVSLFDNPLEAIINEFKMPWTKQALDATHARVEADSNTIAKANNMLQSSAKSASELATTIDEATIKDATEAAANSLAMKAKLMQYKALSSQADSIKAIMSANNARLNGMLDVQKTMLSVQQSQLLTEQRQMLIDEKKQKKEEQDATNADFIHSVNVARGHEGLPLLTKDQEQSFIHQWRHGSKAQRSVLDDWYIRGSMADATGEYKQGTTLQQAEGFRKTNGLAPANDAQREIVDAVKESMAAASKADINPKTQPSQFDQAARQHFSGYMKQWQKNIVPGGNSPFQPLPYDTVAKMDDVKNNPAFQTVLKPMLEADPSMATKQVDMQQVSDVLVKAIQDKKVTAHEAALLMNSMALGTVHINNSRITRLPQLAYGFHQDSYNVKLQYKAAFGMTIMGAQSAAHDKKVDFTKLSQVEHYLARAVSGGLRFNLFGEENK